MGKKKLGRYRREVENSLDFFVISTGPSYYYANSALIQKS